MGYSPQFVDSEPSRATVDVLEGAVVLEFGAPWCGHCKAAQPLIASAFARHERVRHMRVEDGPGRPLGRSFRVKLWPTLVFLVQGQEITRVVRPVDAAEVARALAQIEPAAGGGSD